MAGADGRLSSSFLLKHYAKVDIFDGCPIGTQKAKEAIGMHKNFGYVEQSYMQDFKWMYSYCIRYMYT